MPETKHVTHIFRKAPETELFDDDEYASTLDESVRLWCSFNEIYVSQLKDNLFYAHIERYGEVIDEQHASTPERAIVKLCNAVGILTPWEINQLKSAIRIQNQKTNR